MSKLDLKTIIKESITDYLSELNSTNEEDTNVEPAAEATSKVPKITLENNISKDGKIYLVKTAMNESTDSDMVEERLLSELIGEEYCGVYNSKEKAMAHSKKALKERDLLMKENVKKGQAKIGGLEKQVADLKAQMQKLIDSPEMRGELSNYTAKLEKTEQVLEKLKAAIEKSSPKKAKKETKDDE